jgi:hypothetical protein
MKNAVIILGLLCALLVLFAYKKSHGANELLEQAATSVNTLSNKLTEVQTRMVLTQAVTSDTLTNLQGQLTGRLQELASLSNRLDQLGKAKQALQKELEANYLELQTKRARLAELQGLPEQAQSQALAVASLEQSLATGKVALASARAEKDVLEQELYKLRVQKAELELKLLQPSYLRLRAAKLEDEAALARKLAKSKSKNSPDRRAHLELQPDGTVQPLPPTNRIVLQDEKPAKKK